MPADSPAALHPEVASLLTRRLVVVTGKGGVGKTTVAAALALSGAARGQRVLLAQFESPVDAGMLLTGRAVGADVTPVGERLEAVNMNPRASLAEFGMQVFRLRAIVRAVMENRAVRPFLRAIPGLDDYAMLGKAWHHANELRGGRARFDLVVVDGPATGQMVKTLSVPRAILQVVPTSMLTRDAAAVFGMLQDPGQSAFVIVTLAEELPVAEALDLEAALRGDLKMPLWGTVVNQVYPPSHCPELLGDAETGAWRNATVRDLVRQARLLARRRAINEAHLEVLRARSGVPLFEIPLLFVDRLRPAHLSSLGSKIRPSCRNPEPDGAAARGRGAPEAPLPRAE